MDISKRKKAELQDEYEDLVFKAIMAYHIQNESQRIKAFAEGAYPSTPESIEKLYKKNERKEAFGAVVAFGKKALRTAAMFVLIVAVSVTTSVVAFADFREAVAEALYKLVTVDHGVYTTVGVEENPLTPPKNATCLNTFYDFTWLPSGYDFNGRGATKNSANASFTDGENYIDLLVYLGGEEVLEEAKKSGKVKDIKIGGHEGVIITSGKMKSIYWKDGNLLICVKGDASKYEITKAAKSVKLVDIIKYEPIDEMVFYWEGAFTPTYLPEYFEFICWNDPDSQRTATYSDGEFTVLFGQISGGKTEDYIQDADYSRTIQIGEYEGILTNEEEKIAVYWEAEDTLLFIKSDLLLEEIIKIAKSIMSIEKAVSPEIPPYSWEGAYAPAYVPEQFRARSVTYDEFNAIVSYDVKGNTELFISFYQNEGEYPFGLNDEEIESSEHITLGENPARLVWAYERHYIFWQVDNMYFCLYGNIGTVDLIKMAESVAPAPEEYYQPPKEEEEPETVFEIYNWEGALAPSYLPEGYLLENKIDSASAHIAVYSKNENIIRLYQDTENLSSATVDTEGAKVETVKIGKSEAMLVYKDGWYILCWNTGDKFITVESTAPKKEVLAFAKGLRPLVAFKTPEEVYNWENAYAPAYIPEGFYFTQIVDMGIEHGINYSNGEKSIIFNQTTDSYLGNVDTENAEIKTVTIGESEAMLILKDDRSMICWGIKDEVILSLTSTIPTEELIKVAKSIYRIDKVYTEEEVYYWKNAFAPKSIPEGFKITEFDDNAGQKSVVYTKEEKYLIFSQFFGKSDVNVDTENATVENIMIGENKAMLITKKDRTAIYWTVDGSLLEVMSNISRETTIETAKSVTPFKETLTDKEIYSWDGALAPEYIPKGYVFSEKLESYPLYLAVYKKGEKEIHIWQDMESNEFAADTENTEFTKNITVNGNEALFIYKDGMYRLYWFTDNCGIRIEGHCTEKEILDIAKSIKPVK